MDILAWIFLVTVVITLFVWVFSRVRTRQSLKHYGSKTESSQPQLPTSPSVHAATSEVRRDLDDSVQKIRERFRNEHDYGMWIWENHAYTERLLKVTHPIDWHLLGVLTPYYIPWVNRSRLTNLLGASLSWVKTNYSVGNIFQDQVLAPKVATVLVSSVQDYLKMDDDPGITLQDRLYGIRPYSRDSITEEISQNVHRLVGPSRGQEFLQTYYQPDEDIEVRYLPEIPYNGATNGDEVVNFPAETIVCFEASTRGLRYLIFFFDKLPLCVCELHLIKLADEKFGMLDYLLASYFINNLQVNANLLDLDQLKDSRKALTLAAGWYSAVHNCNTGTAVLTRIDGMSGFEFEQFIGQLLEKRGFEVEVTKGSGDFGVDVIAQKAGTKLAIQVKRQADKVSRNAVSDAVAGKSYYHCNQAMVITNSYFHDSAIVLAHSTRCELVDRDILQQWIVESF